MALPSAIVCMTSQDSREADRGLSPQPDLDQANGKCQSDRSQVTGRKLLVGQLAPLVTWDI